MDSLGGTYSDDSNDSFFDEPKITTKKPNLSKVPDKKSISNLFGFNDDKPKPKKDDWLGLDSTEDVQTKPNPGKGSKKITFEEDDMLSSLVVENKAAPIAEVASKDKGVAAKSKSNLIESLFGLSKPEEKNTSFDDILKKAKPVNKAESPVKSAPVKAPSSVGFDLGDSSREGRRSRHSSATSRNMDPFGLFSADSKPDTASTDVPMSKSKPLGSGDAGSAEHESVIQKSNVSRSLPNWLDEPSAKTNTLDKQEVQTEKNERVRSGEDAVNPALESLLTQQKLTASHLDYQNTSVALQQQESQLLIALQLKKYEENLAQMQRKQQDILIKQEQQFSHLLEKQFEKQQIMENNMHLQQQRINNNIQLLLSQPTIAGNLTSEQQEEIVQLKKVNTDENTRLYEEMISTLKERQHEEIFILNESYKKQINLLENSMETVEQRLKSEFANLSEQFNKTIESLKNEHGLEVNKHKQKLEEVSSMHEKEIKQMRENHGRVIEEIRYEYSTLIENFKKIKQNETSMVENANDYTKKLDCNLEMLDVNSKILNEIRSKVQQDYGVLNVAREESLKAKEEEIRMMQLTLEKSREATDIERAQLMALVRSLEFKLAEQSHNFKEERWALQQAAAIFTARTAAFDREMEFARTSLDRERDQLKTLKENMLAEQEKTILQLTEEKLLISAEKSRLETRSKLNDTFENKRDKVEIDAAIQVAKDAADRIDREREKLQKKQCELESLKQSVVDKRHQLMLRETQLQDMFLSAERKAKDGDRALSEAKALEIKYNSRLKDIQAQLISLSAREKKLAEEKIALSKERVSLHNKLQQTKKCSLCTSDNANKPDDLNCTLEDAEQDFSPRIFTVTDPDILRLRYEIGEERASVPKLFDETSID
ncbi:hypothetical protein FQA39_LY15646 [Lamprigera yunnana]|nr:hypothetical protein FQA39_LY15646 [Lamprigera yunnana]